VNERNKTVDVHYYITPGKSFTLDTLIVESEDTTILPMVHSVLKKSSFRYFFVLQDVMKRINKQK